jgi:hypothetical protein
MNPVNSSIHPYTRTTALLQPSTSASPRAQHRHPTKLPLARLSDKSQSALERLATQSSVDHQRVALLLRNALSDGTLSIQSEDQGEAAYTASVDLTTHDNPMRISSVTGTDLTIKTQLNEQSQYEITSIALAGTSSRAAISISLTELSQPLPDPATSSRTSQPSSLVSNIDAQYSRGQLAQARIHQHQNLSGGSPLSGSLGPQSPSTLHTGSAVGRPEIPGPTRTQSARAGRTDPYPTPGSNTVRPAAPVRGAGPNLSLRDPFRQGYNPRTEVQYLRSAVHQQMVMDLPLGMTRGDLPNIRNFLNVLERNGQEWQLLRGEANNTRPLPLENAVNAAIRNGANEGIRRSINRVYGLELRGFSGRRPPVSSTPT